MRTHLLLLATMASICAQARAADGTQPKIDDLSRRVGAPTVSSAFASDNLFQVQAANGSSSATIKASAKRSSSSGDFSVISLIGQAPIAKDSGSDSSTSLASLDGLASGTTLALKYADTRLRGMHHEDEQAFDDCEKIYKPLFLVIKGKDAKDWVCDEDHVKALMDNEQLKQRGTAVTQQQYDSFREHFFAADASVTSWGGTVKGGYQDFTFYDPTSLAQQKKRDALWSASAFFAYLPVERVMALTATASVQSSYKDAKSASKCLAAAPAGSAFLTCANGPIGAPPHKTTEILALEWRQEVMEKVAVSLQASRDFRNKITTVQLPVYFIHGAKTGLTGGVNFGWTSTDHKASMGVFVNQAFSLFN